MSEQRRSIEFPLHPDDADLPLSIVQLKMPSGKVFEIRLPMQGRKTIEGMLAILEIWKPTLVIPEPEIRSDDLRPTEIYTQFQPIALATTGSITQ